MKGNEKLTRREILVIDALLTSRTVKEASKVSGVSEATIYRYLKKPHVRSALRERRSELINGVLRYFTHLGKKAVDNIASLLDSENEKVKFEASKFTLETLLKLKQIEELEDRLERLEAIVGEMRE